MAMDQNEGGSMPHEDPERWVPRLRRLLDAEFGALSQLETLGDRQSELIRQGDTESLLALLAQRQALIDEVGRLNEQLLPFRRGWDTLVDRIPDAHRDPVRARVLEIQALAERVRSRDETDRAAMEHRRSAVSAQLDGVRRTSDARAAYGVAGAGGASGPLFQDRSA